MPVCYLKIWLGICITVQLICTTNEAYGGQIGRIAMVLLYRACSSG